MPDQLRFYCRNWNLELQGNPWHGYLGLVYPVRRGTEELALKLTWVDEETRDEAAALRCWNGRGAVQLLAAEPGVLLLERLQARSSLAEQPLATAVEVSADLLRRLSVPAPPGFLSMQDYARGLFEQARRRGSDFQQPFPPEWLTEPPNPRQAMLVNQDLHYANILEGKREPWLVIDPKPLCGDPEFALAPLLWNRSEEGDLKLRFEQLVSLANLERERALDWTLFRVLEYWLWALSLGLTQDPPRCERVAAILRAIR